MEQEFQSSMFHLRVNTDPRQDDRDGSIAVIINLDISQIRFLNR